MENNQCYIGCPIHLKINWPRRASESYIVDSSLCVLLQRFSTFESHNKIMIISTRIWSSSSKCICSRCSFHFFPLSDSSSSPVCCGEVCAMFIPRIFIYLWLLMQTSSLIFLMSAGKYEEKMEICPGFSYRGNI